MSNHAFYYVDGIPTKGTWVEIDSLTTTDDVVEALVQEGYIPRGNDGEPAYGGDLLVADIEGDLARAFYTSSSDHLYLAGLVEALDYCERNNVDEGAVAAFLDDQRPWNEEEFSGVYRGKYASEGAFAEESLDDSGDFAQMPESLRCYFDYEAYARDLFINEFIFIDGYVFWRN